MILLLHTLTNSYAIAFEFINPPAQQFSLTEISTPPVWLEMYVPYTFNGSMIKNVQCIFLNFTTLK